VFLDRSDGRGDYRDERLQAYSGLTRAAFGRSRESKQSRGKALPV